MKTTRLKKKRVLTGIGTNCLRKAENMRRMKTMIMTSSLKKRNMTRGVVDVIRWKMTCSN